MLLLDSGNRGNLNKIALRYNSTMVTQVKGRPVLLKLSFDQGNHGYPSKEFT